MKVKPLFVIFSFFIFIGVISCDDDMNDIGESVQPPGDTIAISVDTIALKARTISMLDSVYARTIFGVLGKYEDKTFGTIKSDYLCQFYYPNETEFKGTLKQIDSVRFIIDYKNSMGDPLAIMGLSLYKVTSPLKQYYYTNADASKYCNMDVSLANEAYSVSGARIDSATSNRLIVADLGVSFGQELYNAWANGTVKDNKSFNEFFPGLYVTTNFGSGSLIKVLYTSLETYYSYTYLKDGAVRDSTGVVQLAVTQEVIQLNQIKNTNPEELFVEGTGATYLKTPAGVYTEITFPIGEIAQNMKKANMTIVNSAQLSLKGYTEKESSASDGLTSPTHVLLVNKDSIDTFFKKASPLPDSKTSFVATLESSTNSYNFGNISPLITAYKDKNIDKVVYYVVPVEVEYLTTSTTLTTLRLSNYMMPGSAILRSDSKNMKLDLIYSRF